MLRVVEALSRALGPPPDDEPTPSECASPPSAPGDSRCASTPSDAPSPSAIGLALPCAYAGGGGLCCSGDAQSAPARLAAFESRFGAGGARGCYT